MNEQKLLQRLEQPTGPIEMVLDTDAFNEVDDQFAIAYMLSKADRLHCHGICAAPFLNEKSSSPQDGMEKSYNEICHMLSFFPAQAHIPVFRGSTDYLPDEYTPRQSDAASFIVREAMAMSDDVPLYVAAIGAITNVASALLLEPKIKERIVVVWLGGHGLHTDDNSEFNMRQDIAAARVLFASGTPIVQLPCRGVVDAFRISGPELTRWLKGQGELCDDLVERTVCEAEKRSAGMPWTRVIWDVTAIGWLLGESKFMKSRIIPAQLPQYDNHYSPNPCGSRIRYVYEINRDALMADLIFTLRKGG